MYRNQTQYEGRSSEISQLPTSDGQSGTKLGIFICHSLNNYSQELCTSAGGLSRLWRPCSQKAAGCSRLPRQDIGNQRFIARKTLAHSEWLHRWNEVKIRWRKVWRVRTTRKDLRATGLRFHLNDMTDVACGVVLRGAEDFGQHAAPLGFDGLSQFLQQSEKVFM